MLETIQDLWAKSKHSNTTNLERLLKPYTMNYLLITVGNLEDD